MNDISTPVIVSSLFFQGEASSYFSIRANPRLNPPEQLSKTADAICQEEERRSERLEAAKSTGDNVADNDPNSRRRKALYTIGTRKRDTKIINVPKRPKKWRCCAIESCTNLKCLTPAMAWQAS